jgi:hypothetical protein
MSRTEIGEQFSTNTSPHGGYEFYFMGNSIVLPQIPTTGSVRQWHYRRPNALVATSACAQVTNIASNVVTCTTVPTTFTTSYTYDFIKNTPHFDWLAIDQSISAVVTGSSGTITFSSTPPSTLAIGDWVCLSEQAPIPQIPVECMPLLEQRCVVKIQEIQGYFEKAKISQAKLEEMEKDVFGIISPRAWEEPKRIIPDPALIGGQKYFKKFLTT